MSDPILEFAPGPTQHRIKTGTPMSLGRAILDFSPSHATKLDRQNVCGWSGGGVGTMMADPNLNSTQKHQ